MDIFSLFPNKPYTFLELDQVVEGNTVKKESEATGIIKIRAGMTSNGYSEVESDRNIQSATSVHIKPDEPFLSDVGHVMLGHGIRINDVDYRIIGEVQGYDHEEDAIAFYKVTLKKESLASWEESELPLS